MGCEGWETTSLGSTYGYRFLQTTDFGVFCCSYPPSGNSGFAGSPAAASLLSVLLLQSFSGAFCKTILTQRDKSHTGTGGLHYSIWSENETNVLIFIASPSSALRSLPPSLTDNKLYCPLLAMQKSILMVTPHPFLCSKLPEQHQKIAALG